MPNTNAMKKSFGFRGAEAWNTLLIDLKSPGIIATFKSIRRNNCRFLSIKLSYPRANGAKRRSGQGRGEGY